MHWTTCSRGPLKHCFGIYQNILIFTDLNTSQLSPKDCMTDGFKVSHIYKQQTKILFSRFSKSSSEPSRTRLFPWVLLFLICGGPKKNISLLPSKLRVYFLGLYNIRTERSSSAMALALVLFLKILPRPEKYDLLAHHKH